MAKLTREQIAKGLDTLPMSQILQGASGTVPKLTNKQIEFAKQVALGKTTQADAYRNVYKSTGRPKTVGSNASRLATDDRISTAIDAFKAAEQYKEYQTPTQLRALVVHQLTKHVLDDDFPPAQRVACLKLLGSVAEIGLFVDRKETLVVHQSSDIRARLMEQLRTITATDVVERVDDRGDDADSLLDEINSAKSDDATPTHSPPPECDVVASGESIHTIPLEAIPEITLEVLPKIPLNIDESGEFQPSPIKDENVNN